MRRLLIALLLIAAAVVGLIAAAGRNLGPLVITREGEQKTIIFLGEVRVPKTAPGITFRWPFVEAVETFETRALHLSTEALPIQTRDGEQLMVDNYVIWRIADPVAFRRAFPGRIVDARLRIDRAVRDAVREVIGRHTLTEVLKDRRADIMKQITENNRAALAQDGIDIVDVRINRTELPEGTETSVYARMNAERERLAKKNRAEGEERARRIRAEADRDARVIVAESRRDAEIARGVGDAEATRIYAESYGTDPDFYAFTRSLEAYTATIGERTTLVLSPDTEFFQYLDGRDGRSGRPPAGR